MSNEQIEKVIREYITKVPHMSLATVNQNKPWVCEVHFANDENLNLYLVSKVTTRHCQEIASNPNVGGTIVRQHSLDETPAGVYFEGQVERIESPSQDDIIRYTTALNRDAQELTSQLAEGDGKSMYKISVSNWAIFGNFDGKGHAKHELEWGQV